MDYVSPLRQQPTAPPPPPLEDGELSMHETSLKMNLKLRVTRSKRRRCPRCGNRRVLYQLTAWADDQFAGAGKGMCAACAGFREPDEARAARRGRG